MWEDFGMSETIARIEVYRDYDEDGSMNLDLPFSYGCLELNLMGYSKIEGLIEDIRKKLKEE